MSIQLLSSEALQSANSDSWKALPDPFYLGPLDHLVPPFIPIAVVFVYSSASSSGSQVISVDHLRRAIQHLLDYYPQLTGRLQINTEDGTPEVTRLGAGAGFFTAHCSEALPPDIAPKTPFSLLHLPDGGNVLLPPSEPTLEATCRDPMFAVQHTRFATGGATLGVRLLHTIGDADGFFQLVRDLAELYRGVAAVGLGNIAPELKNPPHIRSYRSELSGGRISDNERATALRYKPALMTDGSTPPLPTLPPAADPASLPTPPTEGRFLRFSPAELRAIKSDAASPDSSSTDWTSTFDALSAHLYQSIHRARLQLCQNNETILSRTDFLTPINLRSRLGISALPPYYFPQALLTAQATMDPDILANGPLWRAAKAVHDLTRVAAVSSVTEIDQTLYWIAAQSDKRKIESTFQYGTGSLMISQWNKFEMYNGATFDSPPALVAPPFTSISLMDGLIYFLSTAEELGAIEVCAALGAPVWKVLDGDIGFRRFES